MLQIKKLRADNVLDFAAEELKKYLRMMMPHGGEITISYEPGATTGFRLGLMEDFGLACEAPDPTQDDVVHIDTTAEGGILAGSNPRSVLFAVYRLLKENGCRFLFPGRDGEYIPMKPVQPVSYHKMADHRFRGHTTEGGPSLEQVLDYIDYHAKQELNFYGVLSTFSYHRRYYIHNYNQANRPPEPVSRELVQQWEALCEAELVKRGMIIRGGGHMWNHRAAGFDPADRYLYKEGKKQVSEEIRPRLALINGKRDLRNGDPAWTNICMSQAETLGRMADLVAEYARTHPHMTQIDLSLADTSHNHCECEECSKLRPADFLIRFGNEVDKRLIALGLKDTKLVLSSYVDCMFPPLSEKLNNPDHFVLQHTPIRRDYSMTVTEDTPIPPTKPYIRNAWEFPQTTEAILSYFLEWQKVIPELPCMCYEYHYWLAQYRDPGMMAMSRRLYEDVRSWKHFNMDGCIQDGSNKSFFPNGFIDHIYNATLLNRDCDYEAELADYFLHIYGEDWQQVRDYLEQMSQAFHHPYMCGFASADPAKGKYYDPSQAEALSQVHELAARARRMAKAHLSMPTRPQTVSWRLLLRHADYCEGVAEIMIAKCKGQNEYAWELLHKFIPEFGKHEFELERYLDYELAAQSWCGLVKDAPGIEF